jgi:hypothetical protein
MQKSSSPPFKVAASDRLPDAPAPTSTPSKEDVDATWDVVIRAHYLAHELRYYCARYNLASSVVANAVAENLEKWATRFGAELEAMEASSDRRRDAPARRR